MRRAALWDGIGALVLTAAGVAELIWSDVTVEPLSVLQIVLVTGAVAGRRTVPVVAVAVAAGAAVISPAMHQAAEVTPGMVTPAVVVPTYAVLVLVYSVAAYERRRDLCVAGTLLLLAGLWAGDLVRESVPQEFLASMVGLGLAWAAGRLVGTSRYQARRLRETNDELVRQRRRAEEAAAEAERSRIARDLHDVVAHSLSVVALQADAADALLPDHPDEARRAVVAVRDTATEALGEMRRLLRVLRPLDETVDRGLGDIEALVDEVRATGAGVVLRVDGDQAALSDGADLSAYRVLQEALTNARRHGSGGTALVDVRHSPDAVEITVTNPLGSGRAHPTGFGLIGVRERVQALGGRVEAGPRDGTWVLHARLPREPT